MISAYESGEKKPGHLNLARLSDRLHFPVEFFYGPDLEEPPLDALSFRALTTMTAAQRNQAHSSATFAQALSDWIDERFTLPQADVPRLRGVDPETAAIAVRSEWGLGESPISNMTHLLEAHGIRVFSLVEECREVDAFSYWRGAIPYLFLNTVKTAEHSRMDASHELGHLVLHHWREGPHGRDAEKEAHAFGSAFLMPYDDLVASTPRTANINELIHAKHRWNVSLANLVYRMHQQQMLSDWHYRSLFIEIRRKYRTSEPEAMRPEKSQVFEKVFQSLRHDGMTKADVARELLITPDELEKMIFGLVLMPVDGSTEAEEGPRSGERPQLKLV